MKKHLLLLIAITCLASCASRAQQNTTTQPDETSLGPGAVRVIATVSKISDDSVTLQIKELVESTQGIINLPAPGQELVVNWREKKTSFKKGETIRADLKEKLGVDASQSSYVLLNAKKL